jgi:VWFA-related protein
MKSLLLMAVLAAQSEVPIVHEVVEVRLANFDVVVTDEKGKHVRGLTAADFELLENGKPQEITNLTEYSAIRAEGAPAADRAGDAPPVRHVVIFIDVTTTDLFERKRACAALGRFVEGLGPDDQVTVISWNRVMKIVVPATNDRERLKAGLQIVARELALQRTQRFREEAMRGGGAAAERRTMLRLAARAELAEARQAATALTTVLTRLGGLSGRKALLLVTKGFTRRIDEEVDDLVDRDALRAIAESANAAGVTVYGIHSGGVSSGMSVEDGFIDQATASGAWRTELDAASVDGLRFVAGRTGGRVAANTNYFTNALDAIAGDLANYYSIGYRVHARRVRGEKEIAIRTKNARYTVRARRTFVERSWDDDIAHQVLANLYFPAARNDLGITAVSGATSKTKKNRFAVAIDVKIPYASMSFVPAGEENVAELSVFIGSVDRTGSSSSIMRYNRTVRVATEKLSALATEQYTYGFDVDLRTLPGDQKFAVAVLDNTSKVAGYATVEVKGLK